MPRIVEYSKALKPYVFHGLDLDVSDGAEQAIGQCPWCGRDGKFYVSVETGQWDCKVCRAGTDKGGGNVYTFLRLLHEASDARTNGQSKELADDRKLLYPETLAHWGIVESALTGDWLVPGYSADGKLTQLYRYLYDSKAGKRKLLPTPGLGHAIHRPMSYDGSKPIVYVCEGPWDALALWEILRSAKRSDEGELALTGSEVSSLLAEANVVAIPGCGSVGEPLKRWLRLFAGKLVVLLFDNDHPRQHQGKLVNGAGQSATRKAAQVLANAEEPPAEIHYIKWGEHGYDPDLPDGHDVRDALATGNSAAERLPALGSLLSKVEAAPADWVPGHARRHVNAIEMELAACISWDELENQWRKTLKWTDGLSRTLSAMLATVTSTKAVGDQLWIKVIGPPSCGKSVLCEAVSVNRRYVTPKSTLTGFHSGFKTDAAGKEDNSLIPLIRDKTLVTKDGDTLLQSGSNLGKILAQARDLYDGSARTHYGNLTGKDYQGLRTTWILCGTESLRQLDASELGERFLDCVVVDDIDEDLEDEIAWRVANRTDRELCLEADGKPETLEGPDMVRAKQLTGGYVEHLRTNAKQLLGGVVSTEQALRRCQRFAKFVAFVRARPSLKQEEKAQRELSYRLVSQLVRFAKCTAVVLNRRDLDAEVMRRVRQITLDTARGRTFEIVRHLFKAGQEGLSLGTMAALTNQSEDAERRLLRFLRRIKAVETYAKKLRGRDGIAIVTRPKWRLTERLRTLYEEVTSDDSGE